MENRHLLLKTSFKEAKQKIQPNPSSAKEHRLPENIKPASLQLSSRYMTFSVIHEHIYDH